MQGAVPPLNTLLDTIIPRSPSPRNSLIARLDLPGPSLYGYRIKEAIAIPYAAGSLWLET